RSARGKHSSIARMIPGAPVADHQQRIWQTPPPHIAEEFPAARGVFLGPRRQMQQRLLAVRQDPPSGQHRLTRLAHASYSAHSRSVISLTAVRLSRLWPASLANSASMSRVDSPRAYISTA